MNDTRYSDPSAKAWNEICTLCQDSTYLASLGASSHGGDGSEVYLQRNGKRLAFLWERDRSEICARVVGVPRVRRFSADWSEHGYVRLRDLSEKTSAVAGVREMLSTLISELA